MGFYRLALIVDRFEAEFSMFCQVRGRGNQVVDAMFPNRYMVAKLRLGLSDDAVKDLFQPWSCEVLADSIFLLLVIVSV